MSLMKKLRQAVSDPQMRSRIVIVALYLVIAVLVVLSMFIGR